MKKQKKNKSKRNVSRINGRKYPWPHNPMVQPMKPIAAPLWKRAPSKPAAAFWGDSDGDGVMNAFDCAPNNPRKQGAGHGKYTATYTITAPGEYGRSMIGFVKAKSKRGAVRQYIREHRENLDPNIKSKLAVEKRTSKEDKI